MDLDQRLEALTDEQVIEQEEDLANEIDGIGDIAGRRRRSRSLRRRLRRANNNRLRRAKRARSGSASKMTAVANVFSKNASSKAKFEVMKGQLPKVVQDALSKGQMQINDTALYGIKSLDGKQSHSLLEPSDDFKIGDTNVNRAQLERDKYFLLTGIRLEFAYDYNGDGDYNKAIFDNNPRKVFEMVETDMDANRGKLVSASNQFGLFQNGHFELKAGSTSIVPEIPIAEFLKSATDEPENTFMLDNPKIIEPLKEIDPEVSFPAALNNVFVKVTLVGAWTEKN